MPLQLSHFSRATFRRGQMSLVNSIGDRQAGICLSTKELMFRGESVCEICSSIEIWHLQTKILIEMTDLDHENDNLKCFLAKLKNYQTGIPVILVVSYRRLLSSYYISSNYHTKIFLMFYGLEKGTRPPKSKRSCAIRWLASDTISRSKYLKTV